MVIKGTKLVKGWSRKYNQCINCGRSDRKYRAKGLCSSCYHKLNDYKYPHCAKKYRTSPNGKEKTKARNRRYYEKLGKKYQVEYREKNRELLNKKIRERIKKKGKSYLCKILATHKRRLRMINAKLDTDINSTWLLNLKETTIRCPICGVKLIEIGRSGNQKQLDHIIPISKGGLHIRSNVRYICARCNNSRGNRSIV